MVCAPLLGTVDPVVADPIRQDNDIGQEKHYTNIYTEIPYIKVHRERGQNFSIFP